MAKTLTVEEVINKMTDNKEKNIKLVKKNLNVYSSKMTDYLFNFIKEPSINEDKKMFGIEAFLELGASPKKKESFYDPNIISSAIYHNFSEKNIIKIINLLIDKGYNLNDLSDYRFPILYELIGSYKDNITNIYKCLVLNGYDIFLSNKYFDKIEEFALKRIDKIKDYDLFIKTYKEDKRMLFPIKFNKIIDEINIKYPKYDCIDSMKNNLLHIATNRYYDEELIFEAIKYLLEKGMDPNSLNINDHNFIFTSIDKRHSIVFICDLIKLALKYGLNINHKDKNGNTIIHKLIKVDILRKIIPIFELLLKNNFDYLALNNDNESIIYLVLNSKYIADKEEFIEKYSNLYDEKSYVKDDFLVGLGEVKYSSDFIVHSYLNNTLGCFSIKLGIIVGKDCSLKTATLNNICNYYTDKGENKAFLTSADNIINNCLTIGELEDKLFVLIEKCVENNLMLFIDDFDKLYNNKSTYEKKRFDIVLNHYLNNDGLRFIVTMNKGNKNILSNSILAKHIKTIEIKELYNDKLLLLFINDYIRKQEKEYNIKINDDLTIIIKQILLLILNNDYVNDRENISNVKIVTEIINNLYNYKQQIDINNLIYSVRINQDIKEEAKEIIIEELNKLNDNNRIDYDKMIKKLKK